MSDCLQNEGNRVASQKPMPEVAKGATEIVRCTTGPGKQRRLILTPIPMDRVMQSDMCRMHMELPEASMEAASDSNRDSH